MQNKETFSISLLEFNLRRGEITKLLGEYLKWWDTMKHFGITNWYFGGSAALMYYGINLGRPLSDIDIIVPKGTVTLGLLHTIESSFFAKVINYCVRESGSEKANYPYHGHIEFKLAGVEFPIDIVESPLEGSEFSKGMMWNNISCIENIIVTKAIWDRPKDREDLKKINTFLELYK